MKKRTILPIAGLVVLSGIAAISGTFAWFQTVRSATVAFEDAEVRSRDSHLRVKLTDSLNTLHDGTTHADKAAAIKAINDAATADSGDIKMSVKSDEDQFVTDISGNGVNFYKLEQGYRKNDNVKKIDGVSWQIPLRIDDVTPAADGSADGYLVDFTLELSREQLSEGGRALEVYLGSGTKIEPVDDQDAADVKAVKGARMSVSVGGATPQLYAQVAEETGTIDRWTGYDAAGDPTYEDFVNGDTADAPLYMYLTKTGDDQDKAYQVEEYKLVKADVELLSAITDLTVSPAVPADNPYYIGTLTEVYDDTNVAGTTLSMNVRMWIEGTDADIGFADPNIAVGGEIKLVLDLYTLHVD